MQIKYDEIYRAIVGKCISNKSAEAATGCLLELLKEKSICHCDFKDIGDRYLLPMKKFMISIGNKYCSRCGGKL